MDHDIWMRIIDFAENHAEALWWMIVLSVGSIGRVTINKG
jgi:hypothetical protein